MYLDIARRTLIIKKDIRNLIWIQLYIIIFFGFFRDFLGIPSVFYYLIDVLNVCIFGYACFSRKYFEQNTKLFYFLMGIVAVLFMSTIGGYITGNYSFLLYLWGLRFNYRFYIAFFSSAVFFKVEDLFKIKKFLVNILYLNVFISTIEFFMGYTGDYLGGTFGISQGVNAYTNILMVIVTCFVVVDYLQKRTSLKKFFGIIVSCLYLSVITELKFYYFELVVIVFITFLSERMTFRKVALILFVVIGMVIAINAIGYFFPVFRDFFTIESISQYIGDDGYTGQGDFNRLNAVFKVKELFFKNNVIFNIFGFGLGNCSFSSFNFLTSEFYNLYNFLHYQWFTDSFVYIETGAIGLILYEIFFVVIFIATILISFSIDYRESEYAFIKAIGVISLCSIVCSIYNVSLQMESGYLIYIILAGVLIINKQRAQKTVLEN